MKWRSHMWMFFWGEFESRHVLLFFYLSHRHMNRATFSQHTGDENSSQGGDVSEVCIAPRGGVKVALQWLGIHSAPVIWYINGAKSCICGRGKERNEFTHTHWRENSEAGFQSWSFEIIKYKYIFTLHSLQCLLLFNIITALLCFCMDWPPGSSTCMKTMSSLAARME